jgi:hypothetical protein
MRPSRATERQAKHARSSLGLTETQLGRYREHMSEVRARVVWVALVGLACSAKDPPPSTATKFETFALDLSAIVVRPHMCQTVKMLVKATPAVEPAEIQWSADPSIEIRPGFSLKGGAAEPTQSSVMLCAGAQSGRFKFKAELAGRAGYFADGSITVGAPTLPVEETKPIAELLGTATQDFLRVGWESNDTIWAVSRDQTVLRFDAKTLSVASAFYLRGMTDAMPMGNRRWFVRLNKVGNAIYDESSKTFESWFRSLGLDDVNYHELGPYESFNANATIASSWAGGIGVSWIEGFDQNAGVCRMTLLDFASNRRDPFNWAASSVGRPQGSFRPEDYTEVSPNGKYVAYGVGGCSASLPHSGLYDIASKTPVACGEDERSKYAVRAAFSAQSNALAKNTSNQNIRVFDVPSCKERGYTNNTGGHPGFALSPDGNTLARIYDARVTAGPLILQFLEYNVTAGSTLPSGEFRTTRGFLTPVGKYDGTDFNGQRLIDPLSARMVYSPDGTKIAIGLADGHMSVLDLTKPDDQSVTADAEFSGNILKTWLSPNGRYLGLHTTKSGWGIYDLTEKRLLFSTPRIVAVEDTQVIVYDEGALKNKYIEYSAPTVLQDYVGTPPSPPVDTDVCVVRDNGNRVCHVDGQERCVEFFTAVTQKATDARYGRTGCAILTKDAIFEWSPTSTVVARAAYLSSPLPINDQIPIAAKFVKLPDKRLLVPTNRLEIWQP